MVREKLFWASVYQRSIQFFMNNVSCAKLRAKFSWQLLKRLLEGQSRRVVDIRIGDPSWWSHYDWETKEQWKVSVSESFVLDAWLSHGLSFKLLPIWLLNAVWVNVSHIVALSFSSQHRAVTFFQACIEVYCSVWGWLVSKVHKHCQISALSPWFFRYFHREISSIHEEMIQVYLCLVFFPGLAFSFY